MEGKVGLASDRTVQRRDPASGSPTALLRGGEKRNPGFSRAAMFTVSHTHAFNVPASAAQKPLGRPINGCLRWKCIKQISSKKGKRNKKIILGGIERYWNFFPFLFKIRLINLGFRGEASRSRRFYLTALIRLHFCNSNYQSCTLAAEQNKLSRQIKAVNSKQIFCPFELRVFLMLYYVWWGNQMKSVSKSCISDPKIHKQI